jgi:hypothetical protein
MLERGLLERRWYDALGLPDSFVIANITPWSGRGFVIDDFHGQPVRFVNVGATDVVEVTRAEGTMGALLLAAPDVLEYVLRSGAGQAALAAASSYDVLTPEVHGTLAAHDLPLGELYVASEVCAPIAFGSPECSGMHVNADYVVTEVIDENGQPTPDGVAGHLIVTDLLNTAMPLLRYEIGDVVAIHPPATCGCGRALPLITVFGRETNTLSTPFGSIPANPVLEAVAPLAAGPFYIVYKGLAAFELIAPGEVALEKVRRAITALIGDCTVTLAQPREEMRGMLREGGRFIRTLARDPLEFHLGKPSPPRWREHPAVEATERDAH